MTDDLDHNQPVFPPLLTGHRIDAAGDPYVTACDRAAAGTAGAGDLFWSSAEDVMAASLVLEPEVTARTAAQMLHVAMVAFGDSFGALAPAELGIFYRWPGVFLINAARVGEARIAMSKAAADDVPDWLVVDTTVTLFDPLDPEDAGRNLANTTLWNEGCGELTAMELVDSFARHMLTWIHNWESDGFKPVHDAWAGRAEGRGSDKPVEISVGGETVSGRFTGLDEDGSLLLKPDGGETVAVDIMRAVDWR